MRQDWVISSTARSWRAWASPDEKRAAFDYFKRHQDQTYSAVDCLSFVVMEKLGTREALAVDSDFTHRFIARPGPQRG